MAAIASRADWDGPKGFSLESISTASGACGLRREAAASMGSVVNRKVAAAEAAADRCRKERREKRGMRILRLGSLKHEPRKVKRLCRFQLPSVLCFTRVISGAGLDLIALLALDFDLAVGSVFLFVGGRVADVVLAAEFGGDLVEGFAQLVELIADVDHAPAGLLCKLAHITFAGVAKSPVESAICTEQHVDDGIRF